jgi:hypothetical protein
MLDILELDDLVYDRILAFLSATELFAFAQTCKAAQSIVSQVSIAALDAARIEQSALPSPAQHLLLPDDAWQALVEEMCVVRIAASCLGWVGTLNTAALQILSIDRMHVSALAVRELVGGTHCTQLQQLSIRFCTGVHAGQLIDRFHGLKIKQTPIALRQLNVVGIAGLHFFEPEHNGITTFDAVNIELIGTGPEYDYTDRWREAVYDFNQTLSRVPTIHGACVKTDVARCSQGYCRNFDLGRRELAVPATENSLPACFTCGEHKAWVMCRPCISARSCNICDTFICPDCYNIDNETELFRLSATSQPWLDEMMRQTYRKRNCLRDSLREMGARACLLGFMMHRHMEPEQSARITLASCFRVE